MTNDARVCKLCQSADITRKFGKSLIDGKIITDYFECANCGLLQSFHLDDLPTQSLQELYDSVPENLDSGATWRQYVVATRIRELAKFRLLKRNGPLKVLEFGCGSGFLIHFLSNLYGWDMIGYDPYTRPYFSASHVYKEWQQIVDQAPFDLIIATEVFEHFAHPRDELARLRAILNKTQANIYVTTGLYRPGCTDETWNYLAPQSGQHVVFYSRKSHQYVLSLLGGGQVLNAGASYEWLYCLGDVQRSRSVRMLSHLGAFTISRMVTLKISPKIE